MKRTFKSFGSYFKYLKKRYPEFISLLRNVRDSIKHLPDKQIEKMACKFWVLALQKIKKANNAGIAVKITSPSGYFFTFINPNRVRFSAKRYELYKYRLFANPRNRVHSSTIKK